MGRKAVIRLGDGASAPQGVCMEIEKSSRARRVVLRAWHKGGELNCVLDLEEVVRALGAEVVRQVPGVRRRGSFPLAR